MITMLFGKMLQECVMELACLDNCRDFLERANRVQLIEQARRKLLWNLLLVLDAKFAFVI